MQSISTIGLDIVKSAFQVHGVDAVGQVVLRRQLRRRQLLAFFPEAAAIPGGYRGVRLIAPLVLPSVASHLPDLAWRIRNGGQ
jgi:hypothetical protein